MIGSTQFHPSLDPIIKVSVRHAGQGVFTFERAPDGDYEAINGGGLDARSDPGDLMFNERRTSLLEFTPHEL